MLTIQDVGTEILGSNPRNFYVMVGSEYGVKQKYIRMLENFYGEYSEAQSVSDILSVMSTKHFVPLNPAVYVVRYDDQFISSMDSTTEDMINQTHIIGTIVCIYELNKHAEKCAKFLPNYTVSIDKINKSFIVKYLHQDFPTLPDRFINLSAEMSIDYNHAYNICSCMTHSHIDSLYKLSDDEIRMIFGVRRLSTDQMIRVGVASRNFKYLINVTDDYPDSLDSILYSMLSTMLELEKLSCNSKLNSDLREYSKRWSMKDIYNMFMNIYSELIKLRTISSNVRDSLIYLFSLLQFTEIPSVEELS